MIKIGGYELFSVETGEFALDGGAMFGIIPKTLWSKRAGADERNRIDMRLRALLVRGGGKNILVDTGIGDKGDAKFNDIYRIDHSSFSLDSSLAALNLGAEDITDVVLSHLHFDHAGGSTKKDAEGRFVPAFSNAKYYIQKRQYEWALSASERDQASFRKDDFVPLAEHGVLRFMDGEYGIAPGVAVETSMGHTEAQQHLVVRGGGEALFYCADMIPTSIHMELPWIMSYDVRPLVTLDEKKKILAKAVKDSWILFFEHCPDVAAARVAFDGKGYGISSKVSG